MNAANATVRKGPPKVSGLVQGLNSRPPGQLLHPMPRLPGSTPNTDDTPAPVAPEGTGWFLVDISLLDDSPYQHRRTYDPASIDELSATLEQGGQLEAIKIRAKSNGRYELLSGHRRTRAARNIGWTHLKAALETIDDQTAAVQLIISNEQHAHVGDYERGCGYQTLLGLGLDQKTIAQRVGVSKTLISDRLAFFKLPPTLLAVLDQYPLAMGKQNLPKLRRILDANPGMVLACAEGLKKVGEKHWTQEVFLSSLLQKQSSVENKSRTGAPSPLTITDLASKVFATIKQPKGDGRVIEIKIGDGIDCSSFIDQLSSHIHDMAQKDVSGTTADGSSLQ